MSSTVYILLSLYNNKRKKDLRSSTQVIQFKFLLILTSTSYHKGQGSLNV